MPNVGVVVRDGWVVYAGRRAVIRENPGRYKVYLPANLNDLWQELRGRKVKVYLVVEECRERGGSCPA